MEYEYVLGKELSFVVVKQTGSEVKNYGGEQKQHLAVKYTNTDIYK